MRTVTDRIRHALCFELIGFLLVVPLGILMFGLTLQDVGVIGVFGSVIATLWVYCFNYLFDHALLRRYGTVKKTFRQRLLNSFMFEIGLLMVLLPFISFYLNISLWEALKMDIALAAFYLIYSFAYNCVYDYLFPLPVMAEAH
ncbi:PACE efflux transporter [Granulosicoccus antarcticus]|uniref:Chlorhexidine efflux transporter domain-containing protein n=1 Tax=Granulosicoccus antarcticus IMCC3135 TaxID=1192854 RepID=A0A2Z2NXJ3_9GAMM|nr:PACE efflux transporter [Granulosicoccus antarcticus]ASJ74701.1 hypothetical protein IMCC3135_23160 [Granulosicoccus antarcticus IMCC3135]